MVLQASTSIRRKSVTFDEFCFIGQGIYIFKTGGFSELHPPLPFYVNSILLPFLNFDDSFWPPGYISRDYNYNVSHKLLYESTYGASLVLFLSRVPFICLAVLLGLFVFRWAKELYGVTAGLFALFFYSFSPNLLAHSRLATTDITITCFIFIATYYFWKFLKEPTIICLWYVFSFLSIYPHYLAYFNELVGGPNNGYKYLVDSNLDWEQDLPGLQEYLAKNKIDNISLHYFGTADPKYYGFSDVTHVSHGFISGSIDKSTTGIIAISATALQGVYNRYKHRYDWLKDNYKPITKIGYSIFVYNIPESK